MQVGISSNPGVRTREISDLPPPTRAGGVNATHIPPPSALHGCLHVPSQRAPNIGCHPPLDCRQAKSWRFWPLRSRLRAGPRPFGNREQTSATRRWPHSELYWGGMRVWGGRSGVQVLAGESRLSGGAWVKRVHAAGHSCCGATESLENGSRTVRWVPYKCRSLATLG